MVAPGKALEFTPGAPYRKRLEGFPELHSAIKVHLENWPQSGREICGSYCSADLTHGGGNYTVLYKRSGNRVALLDVFETPRQDKSLKDYLKYIRETFCNPSPRRKP